MASYRRRHFSVVAVLVAAAVSVSLAAQRQGRRGDGRNGGDARRAPLSESAQRVQKRSYVLKSTGDQIDYAVFVSTKVKKDRLSPLVIALHGAGVPPEEMAGFVADAAQDHGYIVFAPMGYSLEGWYGINGRLPRDAPANLAELSERDVMSVLDIARAEFKIDEHRIYLLGQSMGGAGALYLGVKYRQIWAAVGATAPAAGGLSPDILEGAKDLPIVLIHGDADQSVQVAQSRRWADKMRALMMRFEYFEIRGGAHRDAILVGAPRVFAFFDKQSKATVH